MKTAKLFGKLKVWQARLSQYVSMVNFAMIFYLYIIESPMGLEWYHWIVIIATGILSIIYIDTRFIMKYDFGYKFNKNPGFQEIKKDIKSIKKTIKLLRKNNDGEIKMYNKEEIDKKNRELNRIWDEAIYNAKKAFEETFEYEDYDPAYWTIKIISHSVSSDFTDFLETKTWDEYGNYEKSSEQR